ncbi:hypothetical protein [Streptomyces mangrovisoli]|uniref:Regulatory protein n=1 Tax=Streptomyces mangrovisoli TaxID=1428628 RepID=A0A1J4NQ01_9ACTN|nr:hypothetical protein [Streptomyces mangrovisoli]OIJ64387.1 hypothetical protein WN71_029665 [Streptomyces mangrovisoli]
MSETTAAATGLASQYSTQVAGDLERNLKEQDRITGELELLQRELAVLQQDHTVLVNIQQALGASAEPDSPVPPVDESPIAPVDERPSAPVDESAVAPSADAPAAADEQAAVVPAPRRKSAGRKGSARAAKAEQSSKPARKEPRTKAASTGTATTKTTTKAATTKAGTTKAGTTKAGTTKAATTDAAVTKTGVKHSAPALVDLVRAYVTGQRQPLSAAEITTGLSVQHPERTIKTTVVRNTLEALVAKAQAHRNKQGSSVYYTAPEAAAATEPAEAIASASAEQGDKG